MKITTILSDLKHMPICGRTTYKVNYKGKEIVYDTLYFNGKQQSKNITMYKNGNILRMIQKIFNPDGKLSHINKLI